MFFLTLWQKNQKQRFEQYGNPISGSHINLYDQKESVLCMEVTKIGEKWLVLLILQG